MWLNTLRRQFSAATLVGAAVLGHGCLCDAVVPPMEGPSFPDRVQRVDERHGPRQIEAGQAAALAEAVQQVGFGRPREPLLDQPGRHGDDIVFLHGSSFIPGLLAPCYPATDQAPVQDSP